MLADVTEPGGYEMLIRGSKLDYSLLAHKFDLAANGVFYNYSNTGMWERIAKLKSYILNGMVYLFILEISSCKSS